MSRRDAPGAPAFTEYARWYDAFNEGKSYDREVDYLLGQIEPLAGRPSRWLDVGCGTGHHLACLRARGIMVEGVDTSESMVAAARAAHPELVFHVDTAQHFALDGGRDVVSMLFHVLNYQVSDAMIAGALERVFEHLGPGGLFVFDFWHTDAVRLDPPEPRVRTASIAGRQLYRLSEPFEDRARSLITVRYQFRWDTPQGELMHEETHALRHFSRSELTTWLHRAGMSLASCNAWMASTALTERDWYGFACARREEAR